MVVGTTDQGSSADDIDPADVGMASVLGDMALGPVNATVTVIEYASMSCSHCAAFNRDVFPKLKATYIDAGKIRFVFREFPLDIKAAAAAMLARCLGGGESGRYFATVDVLFRNQNDWILSNSPDGLKRIARQAGVGAKEFESCLANDEMLGAIKRSREDAIARLQVTSTPSFFVNKVRLEGAPTFEELERVIKQSLGP